MSSKKGLLPQPSDNVHLSKYGYSTSKSRLSREKALRKSSKKLGTLPVLRRLNLIKNISADKKTKKIMKRDVNFLKKQYKKEKSMK